MRSVYAFNKDAMFLPKYTHIQNYHGCYRSRGGKVFSLSTGHFLITSGIFLKILIVMSMFQCNLKYLPNYFLVNYSGITFTDDNCRQAISLCKNTED